MNNYIDLTVLVSMDLAKVINGCLYMPDDDGYAVLVTDKVKTITVGENKGHWLSVNSITITNVVNRVPKVLQRTVRFELDFQFKTNKVLL